MAMEGAVLWPKRERMEGDRWAGGKKTAMLSNA
jgi:hypothetical protein